MLPAVADWGSASSCSSRRAEQAWMIWRFAQLLCSNNFSRMFSVIKSLLYWRRLIKLDANPPNNRFHRLLLRLSFDPITLELLLAGAPRFDMHAVWLMGGVGTTRLVER